MSTKNKIIQLKLAVKRQNWFGYNWNRIFFRFNKIKKSEINFLNFLYNNVISENINDGEEN